jgi:hypothetical protein
MNSKIVVLCKKDLFHKNGTQWFTKGKLYVGRNNPAELEGLIITNDLGQPHMMWSKLRFFKVISN